MFNSEKIIETIELNKQFGDICAINNLNITVGSGDIYGFLGPNGAGKTTTINVLLGLVSPTSGEARLFGQQIEDGSETVFERIGVLPAHTELYDRLSARRHLKFVIRVKNADDDPEALCERVGLADAIDRPAGNFSTGMAQRLKLAMALVGSPDLLLLDEPTSGIDPNAAREIREVIKTENERGTTVFFSSHILGQVEAVCDRIGILTDGELVVEDDIDSLRSTATESTTISVSLSAGATGVADEIRSLAAVERVTAEEDALEVVLEDSDAKHRVINTIGETDAELEGFDVDETSLEDLFAMYTNETSARGEA